MIRKKFIEKFREYHFEFKHLTVLFVILFSFQLLVSFINKSSIRSFLSNTQEWYQKDSAEKHANLTATSFELLIETFIPKTEMSDEEKRRLIQSFNIIFSQQMLHHNIEEICILVSDNEKVLAIDDGETLYNFLFDRKNIVHPVNGDHKEAAIMFASMRDQLRSDERIYSELVDAKTFKTFVPFVVRGEYIGSVYIKNTPDFSFISNQVISNFDETSVIYLSLILLGLLAMYFISSYTVKERDDAQKMLFEEHEENLMKQINYQKELIFTKRIYHTHHKAEKIMGFIKEDLRKLSPENITDTKYRVTKYSNFISRVIYDMKWYDPPVQTIRNQMFKTNLNEVIKFIVDNIFLRVSSKSNAFEIRMETDPELPVVPINEFVVWEIIEPLLQNSIEHGGDSNLVINCKTKFNRELNKSFITIEDNGKGLPENLLIKNENGIKNIFVENVTTKKTEIQNSGYGCYIAYEITKRCGWDIDAGNLAEGGCRFTITISN
ncbi:MAG: ATP-binding protein [Ignavibacteriales bacterium]|nr:MAG: ATP-binding protein [Ignavibacteriales bacterium]